MFSKNLGKKGSTVNFWINSCGLALLHIITGWYTTLFLGVYPTFTEHHHTESIIPGTTLPTNLNKVMV